MTINPIIVQTGGESWIELIDSPPFGFQAIKTFSLPPDEAAGVTSIGNFAFYNGTSLASVTLPAGVTSIGNFAFTSCTSLASITLPAGVTSLGNYAFTNCISLASITLPAGVTSIGEQTFTNCISLMTMDVLRETPPTLSYDSLSGLPGTCSIRVPAGSVDAYKAAPYWSARATRITALP